MALGKDEATKLRFVLNDDFKGKYLEITPVDNVSNVSRYEMLASNDGRVDIPAVQITENNSQELHSVLGSLRNELLFLNYEDRDSIKPNKRQKKKARQQMYARKR